MPGILSNLFDSDASNEQESAQTANATQDADPATDDAPTDGPVAVDIPPPEPGYNGDDPNEGMA